MKTLFETLTKFWYLWVLDIAASILEIFMPKIKGFFVIETKNYKGWIIGNEFDENWK